MNDSRPSRIARLWSRWVSLLDERESPTSLAWVRIALGLVLLVDLYWVQHYQLVRLLWAPQTAGGLGLVSTWESPPLAYSAFGEQAAFIVFAVVVVSATLFTLGLFTRASTLILLLSYAQLGQMMPQSDRGIDMMFRAILVLLLLSRCGQTLSIDAKRKTGRFRDDTAAPAWPRYLIILQLVWTYFGAGIHKTQSAWWPSGDYVALWRVLHDPHFARVDFSGHPWIYPFTQLGTAVTMMFEIGAPLLLLAYYYRRTANQTGWIRTAFNRLHVRELWIATGIALHLGLLLSVRLGIFPLGMLALYPAFFAPAVLTKSRVGNSRVATLIKRGD